MSGAERHFWIDNDVVAASRYIFVETAVYDASRLSRIFALDDNRLKVVFFPFCVPVDVVTEREFLQGYAGIGKVFDETA